MRVYLVDNNTIIKYKLPSRIDDTFLITHNSSDNKECLITFSGKQDGWYLKSNGNVNVISNNQIINEIKVEPYRKYQIKAVGKEQLLSIYFLPTNEMFYKLSYNDLTNITIGNNSECNICYANNDLLENTAIIKKVNEAWVLTAANAENIYVFVNGERATINKLKNGDTIFIEGLKIVWMEKFIAINNPLNMINIKGLSLINDEDIYYDDTQVSEEDKSVSLYKKEDYFSHIPVIKSMIVDKKVVIDNPPEKNSEERLPFLLSMGSSFVMLGSVFMMTTNVYNGVSSGKSINNFIPQLVMIGTMLIGSILIPKLTQRYRNKKKKEREALRQKKYGEYLNQKERELELEINDQLQIMNNNYLSVTSCLEVLNKKSPIFWSRQYVDEEFLTIRVGIGKVPSRIEIKSPEKHFALDDDNLLEQTYHIKDKYLYIEGGPIVTSLKDNNITSIVIDKTNQDNYINGIISELLILHSSMDLKIAIFTSKLRKKRWEYLKYTPHIFSNDKTMRFFATNEEEAKYVSNYLEDILKRNKERKEKNNESCDYVPYYLLIVDDYKSYKSISIINELVKKDSVTPGFSILIIGNSLKSVPDSSKCFIEVFEKDGVILEKETGLSFQKIFSIEKIDELDMNDISYKLINTPVITDDGPSVLPQTLGFLEMFGVCNIEQLNILNRWQTNNPVISLDTTIGVHPNGEKFKLDLHEKYHGPHGLIAGSTGSGKSEFIITYILSLAINYHPYEVQFILIDYKGGGLAGAFLNKENNVKLPHLVGTITNLDTNSMNRSLMSIESEVKRRQVIFNEIRESLGEGTIDIYKYQKLYREGVAKKPLSHLFIICDEFAELKEQQPDFMSQLISISRIGRSLGVHLILATQKPSGVVNDQIWANSRFKVCLKVQDRSDSMEVLKKPDAADIKDIGRFYLQVGYNELFEIGQSGWSGIKYNPSDKIIIKKDESINYINNVGYSLKTIKDEEEKSVVIDYGDELTNIVKYLSNLGEKEDIHTNRLWLDPIPDIVRIDALKEKYHYTPVKNRITPVIGEYDDPVNQIQDILTLDLTNGNTVIYGIAGSGKETLLTNIIRSSIIEHSPDEINIYVVDCGSQTLGIFNMFPHVGDAITVDDEEQVKDLVKMLEKEMDVRKDLFQDYGGNYNDYISHSGNTLPLITVIINNYDSFQEAYDDLFDPLHTLFRDGTKYGIAFVLTVVNTNALRQRIVSYFNNTICLHLNDKNDYRMIINSPRELIPADYFGRGLIAIGERVFEFQTGIFAEKKDQLNSLKSLAEFVNNNYQNKAKRIPTIPKRVFVDSLFTKDYNKDYIPVGYNTDTKNISYFDFQKNKIASVVYSNESVNNIMFITSLTQLLEKYSNVILVDFNKILEDHLAIKHIINKDYDSLFDTLSKKIKSGDTPKSDIYLVIVGIGNISSLLSKESYSLFEDIVKSIKDISYLHIVLYDHVNGYKNIRMSDLWNHIDVNNYIYLGDGVSTQSLFNPPNIGYGSKKVVFPCMAYVIKNNKYELIKHIVDGEEVDE